MQHKSPKYAIQDVISEILHLDYSVEWTPRVVRHEKKVTGHNIQYIDYAVPCFELAKLTGTSVTKLTQEIKIKLDNKLKHNSAKTIFSSEAVSGYLNFQLNSECLERYISDSLHWYRDSLGYFAGKSEERYRDGGEVFDLTCFAQHLINQLCSLQDIRIVCLGNKELEKEPIKRDNIINQIKEKLPSASVWTDSETEAAFVEYGDQYIGLISAKGKRQILHIITDKLLSFTEDKTSPTTIILLPQKEYFVFDEFIKEFSVKLGVSAYFFDPNISKGDLTFIYEAGGVVDIFEDAKEALSSWPMNIDSAEREERKNILCIADFPSELFENTQKGYIPAILDDLDSLIRATKWLTSD